MASTSHNRIVTASPPVPTSLAMAARSFRYAPFLCLTHPHCQPLERYAPFAINVFEKYIERASKNS